MSEELRGKVKELANDILRVNGLLNAGVSDSK